MNELGRVVHTVTAYWDADEIRALVNVISNTFA